MTINGMPLHPLVVHGAVVLVPLALIFAALTFVAGIRRTMTFLAGATGMVAFIFVALAHSSGERLEESLPGSAAISRHAEMAGPIVPLVFATGAVLAVLAILELPRPAIVTDIRERLAAARWVLPAGRVAGIVLAVISVVQVILIGDSGAAAVWSGVAGS